MASYPLPAVFSNFTEVKTADQPTPCQREACTEVIPPGGKTFFIDPQQKGKAGKLVCRECYRHYLSKPDTRTISRSECPTNNEGSNASSSQHPAQAVGPAVNMSNIRQLINESQRQGAHTPQGRVMAMSRLQRTVSSPVPLADSRLLQQFFEFESPALSLLQNILQSSVLPIPTVGESSGAITSRGYSSSHQQYATEQQHWAAASYQPPPPPAQRSVSGQIPARAQAKQEIRIVLQVCFQNQLGKFEKIAIREGVAVDYVITPPALVKFIKTTLCLPITSLAIGFSWEFNRMVVRETGSWQDVSKMDHNEPYFKGRFMKPKPGVKSNGALVFAPPRTPIEFSLIIDAEQWIDAEEFKERGLQSTGSQRGSKHRTLTPEPLSSKRKVPPSPGNATNAPPSPSSVRPSKISRSKASKTESLPEGYPSSSSSLSYSTLTEHRPHENSQTLKSVFRSLSIGEIQNGLFLGGHDTILQHKKTFDERTTEMVLCIPVQAVPFDVHCGPIS